MRLSLFASYLLLNQEQNICIQENILPFPALDVKLLESIRPVTYFSDEIEGMLDCYRYSMLGSGFIINYADTLLFLTARHVLGRKSMHHDYDVFIRKQENMFLISEIGKGFDLKDADARIHLKAVYTPPINLDFDRDDPFGLFSMEANDVTVAVLDENYQNEHIKWNLMMGSLQKSDIAYAVEGDLLYVVGFPSEMNYLEYNEENNSANMYLKRCHLIGHCSKNINAVQAEMLIDINTCNNVNLNGISGAPVFKYEEESNCYKLAGMVISADSIGGSKIRFLTTNYLSIHLMMTDMRFPFSNTDNFLPEVQKNRIRDITKIFGEDKVDLIDGIVKISYSENDIITFNANHDLCFYVLYLLGDTELCNSKNMYFMQNIFSRTNDWMELYKELLDKRDLLTQEHIDIMNIMFHDIEEYDRFKLDTNKIIQKLGFQVLNN